MSFVYYVEKQRCIMFYNDLMITNPTTIQIFNQKCWLQMVLDAAAKSRCRTGNSGTKQVSNEILRFVIPFVVVGQKIYPIHQIYIPDISMLQVT